MRNVASLRLRAPAGLMTPDNRGAWIPLIREAFTGSWQTNIETPLIDVLSHPTVFACITMIAGDIAKMRYELVREADNDVWVPIDVPAFSPVLRKPNGYQNPGQFREHWLISKLQYGNTYVLQERDQRGVVVGQYILDPCRVRPLIAPDGSVFYELKRDLLATQPEDVVVVPAREIGHDRFNCLFHPLVGISPLYAAGIPAMLGLKIQNNSTHFFGNDSTPGGILTTPGTIDQPKATELKERWETNYGGANRGRVAVLGDGMVFTPISTPADKSQLNEQWLMASQAIAVAFHVPWFLVGGPMPPYNNVQTLTVQYYGQCLQPLATSLEMVQDVSLGLAPDKINGVRLGVQFITKDLLLMDSATMIDVIAKGVGAGVTAPNEGRADLNRLPARGGNTPYLQNQMWPLSQLADRPSPNEPAPAAPAMPTVDARPDDTEDMPPEDVAAAMPVSFLKAYDEASPVSV
jgi:HK97 family phage portal protein